ncbi:hypothetical protein GCM10025869_35490 [Homoserinibacter gongjuensis]|uniref:Uncharacterized protein n=1 Tax=Homoserinibacter gongjuensis TaxID=1162968 RepID=A0ABQ6K0I6_9MICO|nr:hypothetical protein GCM10025869_35490 [Homoserinibacter gongjuensis]
MQVRELATQRGQHLARGQRHPVPRAEESPATGPRVEPEGVAARVERGEDGARVESVAKRMPQEPETHSLIL